MTALRALFVLSALIAARNAAAQPVDAGVGDAAPPDSDAAPPADAGTPPDAPAADAGASTPQADAADSADSSGAPPAPATEAPTQPPPRQDTPADKAPADKVPADKANKAPADKAPAVDNPAAAGRAPAPFDGGYTDEEEVVESQLVALDPYDVRPMITAALGLGFGGGWIGGGIDGVMIGAAALRAGPGRVKAELSGGTSLSYLDVLVGGDIAWGNRRYHGLVARGGYAHGWRVREDLTFHELRADVGLASLEGFSWLSARLRVDGARGIDAFLLVVEIERVR